MIDPRLSLLLAASAVFAGLIGLEIAQDDGRPDTAAAAPARTAAAPAAPAAARQRPDGLLAASLARPLFSPNRRPPENAGDNPAGADFADKRLTGIVIDGTRRVAIFAVNGKKPLALGVGDSVDAWRIEGISPGEVSLSGPGGSRNLQPKADANLARQPAFPAPPGIPQVAAQVPVPNLPAARPGGPARSLPTPAAAPARPPAPQPPIPMPAPPRPPVRPGPQR